MIKKNFEVIYLKKKVLSFKKIVLSPKIIYKK